MKLLQTVLGKSSITSIIGYIIAALLAIDELTKAGETDWKKILFAAAIAVFGRASADSKKVNKLDDVVGGGSRPDSPPTKKP